MNDIFKEMNDMDSDKVKTYQKFFEFLKNNKNENSIENVRENGRVNINTLNKFNKSYIITVVSEVCVCNEHPELMSSELFNVCADDLLVLHKMDLLGKQYKSVFDEVSSSKEYFKYGITLLDVKQDTSNAFGTVYYYYFLAHDL